MLGLWEHGVPTVHTAVDVKVHWNQQLPLLLYFVVETATSIAPLLRG